MMNDEVIINNNNIFYNRIDFVIKIQVELSTYLQYNKININVNYFLLLSLHVNSSISRIEYPLLIFGHLFS